MEKLSRSYKLLQKEDVCKNAYCIEYLTEVYKSHHVWDPQYDMLTKKIDLDKQLYDRIEAKIYASFNDDDDSKDCILNSYGVHELDREIANAQYKHNKKDERFRLLVWLKRVKDVYSKKLVASCRMITALQEEGVGFY